MKPQKPVRQPWSNDKGFQRQKAAPGRGEEKLRELEKKGGDDRELNSDHLNGKAGREAALLINKKKQENLKNRA